ncbi:thiamine pyrophosphate-binding protein [uncultured Pseudodesulfovibrio sp.]|uniref:thiamine pyrophosphate-binding protein n=1 Tax=uncultured Pseudodesulfovibrio sp. TaxID=2035858 RepID=UPI0029C9982B|nr:thiamine pyrophosphate-binding protein [uncultured Pseudodesulfovibrio sp.]
MKVSDYIAQVLDENGITTVFGHLGGFNVDIVDSIYKTNKHHYVLSYHEQASSFAANSHSVLTENISVAVASGAPSACNMIAGIANAFFDSNACLFLIGSVHSKAVRTSKDIRQNAFEEIDFVSVVSEITKYAARVKSPDEIRYHLEKAMHVALEGRKGPVVLDIPYDVARADVCIDKLKRFIPSAQAGDWELDIDSVMALLRKAKKPIFLLGGGARSGKSRHALKQLLEKVKIPSVASLCGIDVLPHDHDCYAGFIGHYGNRYANFALANCDCLIILGSRLDERQIGGSKRRFAPNADIVRVDVDKVELGRTLAENISLHTTVETFFEKLSAEDFTGCDYSAWHKVLYLWQERYPSYDLSADDVNVNTFFHVISEFLADDAIVCSDVGQTQMCVAQSLRIDRQRRLINSAGYGSMGFSLPAAVGVACVERNRQVISINGDGGIQMNIQELQTVSRENLPITIIIVNNRCLGMIRRLQERIYDNRTVASVEGYSVPDYGAIANGYGLPYMKIDSPDQYSSLRDFIRQPGPNIVELVASQEMRNMPEPGASIDLQTPLLSDEENKLIKKESQV